MLKRSVAILAGASLWLGAAAPEAHAAAVMVYFSQPPSQVKHRQVYVAPGEHFVAELYLYASAGGVGGYEISLRFDTDLSDELSIASLDLSTAPQCGFDSLAPGNLTTPVSYSDSAPGVEGTISTFNSYASLGTPWPDGISCKIGEVEFVATENITVGGSYDLMPVIETIVDGNYNDITSSSVVAGAEVYPMLDGNSTVGTGSISFWIDLGAGYPAFYYGDLTWDDASLNVQGLSNVNLNALVGGMTVMGYTSEPLGDPPSGWFTSDQASAALTIQIPDGDFICPNSPPDGCPGTFDASVNALVDPLTGISGTALSVCTVGSNPLFTPSCDPLESGLLPHPFLGFLYSEDGFHTCVPTTPTLIECSGRLALNAFSDVDVVASAQPLTVSRAGTFFNSLTNQTEPYGVSVTFDSVDSAGLAWILPISGISGDLPPNVTTVVGTSFSATYFDIYTDAAYQPPITVCIDYPDSNPSDGEVDGSGKSECEMNVLHDAGAGFYPVTLPLSHPDCPVIDEANQCSGADPLCIDTANNFVCGQVPTLSPFVAAPMSPASPVPSLSLPGIGLTALLVMGIGLWGADRRRHRDWSFPM